MFALIKQRPCRVIKKHWMEDADMGARKEICKTNILSVRISDREMEYIRKIMEKTSQSASDVMRDAFRALRERGGSPVRELHR